MIREAELMAYLDGEVTAKRREVIAEAIAGDGVLRQVLQDEQKVRDAVGQCYDPVLNEEVPERLTRLFAARANSGVNMPAKSSIGFEKWRWDFAVPLAASLVLGIFVGTIAINNDDSSIAETVEQLDSSVTLALDTQLSSTQSADQPVQIGSTFSSHDGRVCRTYQTTDTTGVACHDGDQWHLNFYASRESGRLGEYQQANSASAIVMSSVQEMIAGDPFDAREEREARDSGWKIGTD